MGHAVQRRRGDSIAFVDSFCASSDESCVGGGIGIGAADGSARRFLPIEGRAPVLSPDGSHIAFDRSGHDCPTGCGDLYIARIADAQPTKLIENARFPVWSPDGRAIAFERKLSVCLAGSTCADMWTVRPDGTDAKLFIQDARALAWSPDGSNVAFVRAKSSGVFCSSELWVGNQGNNVAPMYRRLTWSAASQILDVAWSPDGDRLAIARHNSKRCQRGDKSKYTLSVMDVDGQRIRDVARSAVGVAWSPAGDRLFFERVNCTTTLCPPPDMYAVGADGAGLTRVRKRTAWPATTIR